MEGNDPVSELPLEIWARVLEFAKCPLTARLVDRKRRDAFLAARWFEKARDRTTVLILFTEPEQRLRVAGAFSAKRRTELALLVPIWKPLLARLATSDWPTNLATTVFRSLTPLDPATCLCKWNSGVASRALKDEDRFFCQELVRSVLVALETNDVSWRSALPRSLINRRLIALFKVALERGWLDECERLLSLKNSPNFFADGSLMIRDGFKRVVQVALTGAHPALAMQLMFRPSCEKLRKKIFGWVGGRMVSETAGLIAFFAWVYQDSLDGNKPNVALAGATALDWLEQQSAESRETAMRELAHSENIFFWACLRHADPTLRERSDRLFGGWT